ncbi:hypothetical protein IPL68_05900 [Candidatus Saccharibacteria bacterium]|nr:MAG: hypothetical protein IPL68_05900 [Candidatus Saccharibacteria bacterium]
MSEVFLPGLAPSVYERFSAAGAPRISERYRSALEQLILLQTVGNNPSSMVTQFLGGPLDVDGGAAWMSPVETIDSDGSHRYSQIIYVNTHPEEVNEDPQNIPVTILEVDEAGHKLALPGHANYESVMGQFGGGKKHVLVRPCSSGMAYYPQVVSPSGLNGDTMEEVNRLVTAIGLREPEAHIKISALAALERDPPDSDIYETVYAKKFVFNGHPVYAYGLVVPDDTWKFYELFSPKPIVRVAKKDLIVRVDSGCDIGQIYDDRGCDCREQLHTALGQIINKDEGIILHIPAQDGRGYGSATKMETEGYKNGTPVATNKANPKKVDTLVAAQRLLGDTFDIRTYTGAGRILTALGIERISLQTDNVSKARGIASSGINVVRRPTGTTSSRGAGEHVAAKHRHELYNDASWEKFATDGE